MMVVIDVLCEAIDSIFYLFILLLLSSFSILLNKLTHLFICLLFLLYSLALVFNSPPVTSRRQKQEEGANNSQIQIWFVS